MSNAAIPACTPDVGALLLDSIMTCLNFAEILLSEHDIPDGIA